MVIAEFSEAITPVLSVLSFRNHSNMLIIFWRNLWFEILASKLFIKDLMHPNLLKIIYLNK